MAGHPRVGSTAAQLQGLQELARSARRDEADRARAIVLSLSGWTSGQIARAFGVTPDSVRRWRSWFMEAGIDGLRASERAGREAVKSEAAAAVAASLLTVPAPGQSRKLALIGALDHATGRLIVHRSPTKRSADFISLLERLDPLYAPR